MSNEVLLHMMTKYQILFGFYFLLNFLPGIDEVLINRLPQRNSNVFARASIRDRGQSVPFLCTTYYLFSIQNGFRFTYTVGTSVQA